MAASNRSYTAQELLDMVPTMDYYQVTAASKIVLEEKDLYTREELLSLLEALMQRVLQVKQNMLS